MKQRSSQKSYKEAASSGADVVKQNEHCRCRALTNVRKPIYDCVENKSISGSLYTAPRIRLGCVGCGCGAVPRRSSPPPPSPSTPVKDASHDLTRVVYRQRTNLARSRRGEPYASSLLFVRQNRRRTVGHHPACGRSDQPDQTNLNCER